MFSIIIPLYNKGRLVKNSIDSVLAQTFQDFEIIVVDDGSTDNCGCYVKEYADNRIHYFFKPNGGASSARNFGIYRAKADWIIFLDADDSLLPNALEVFNQMITKYPECQYFVGGFLWSQQGKALNIPKASERYIKISSHPFFDIWMNSFYPAPRNMAIHKSLVERYGVYDERMSFFEDYEFSLRLLSCGRVVYTDMPVAIYNQEAGGLSSSMHAIEKEMAYYIPEIIEHQNPNFFYKALLNENIEMNLCYWPINCNEYYFYKNMQNKKFSKLYRILHWIRQKLNTIDSQQ